MTIHTAVRNLADNFTGELPSVIHGRTRSSGGIDNRAKAEKSMEDLPHLVAYIGIDGQIEKYKCRFVTQGFRQVKGLHYHESSSPVVRQFMLQD